MDSLYWLDDWEIHWQGHPRSIVSDRVDSLPSAGKILSLVFKYTSMAASWGYAKVCQIYQNHKMIKKELGIF